MSASGFATSLSCRGCGACQVQSKVGRLVARTALVACAIVAFESVKPPDLRADDESLRRIHEALYDTWFPADSLPLSGELRARAHALRSALWTRFAKTHDVKRSLEELRGILRSAHSDAFETRSLARRESTLIALLRNGRNDVRQGVMQTRNLYLLSVYGSPLGRAIAGIGAAADPGNDCPPARAPLFPRTWLAYDRLAQRLTARAGSIDDVIVGSGPAGCVIAHQLQRAGHRVLVLEQGPFVLPGAMNTQAMPRLLESGGRRSSTSGSMLFNNGEVVGGGSTVNIDLVFSPLHASVMHQIESWRRSGHVGAHQYEAPALDAADAWVKDRLGTRTPARSEINTNNQVLWDGALRDGRHPRLYELNTYPPGRWPTPCSAKRSAVSGLLLEAMRSKARPLAMVPDARVLRGVIDRDPGQPMARGVDFVVRPGWNAPGVVTDPMGLRLRAGDTIRVEARRVILCAGALGSAVLLLRSGLADPDVGRGIVAHPAVPVIGRFDRTIDAFRGAPPTVFVDDFAVSNGFMLEAMSAGPEYAALMTPETGRGVFEVVSHYRQLAGFGAMLIDRSSRENRIVLGPNGDPQIRYELTPSDRARLGVAVESAARIMFEAGAREVILPSYERVGDGAWGTWRLSDSSAVRGLRRRLRFVPNATIVTSAHLQSSNPMGTRPDGSVVSTEHRVWGIDGLYVADASVFPSSVGANPMQSVYVFAKLFVDELLEAR